MGTNKNHHRLRQPLLFELPPLQFLSPQLQWLKQTIDLWLKKNNPQVLRQTSIVFLLGLLGAGLLPASHAVSIGEINGTKVDFTGYIKVDAIASSFSDGSLGPGSIGRDFYVPSLTPVGGQDEDVVLDFHVRQTRFALSTETLLERDTLKTYLELDFMVNPDANERISNSYNARIRHAFITYNNWLFGQTWTTFMDVKALPDTLDFIGNTDGIVFGRQTMVRYTYNNWDFALENPESTITPFGGGGRVVTDDNSLPDAIVRYRYQQSNLSLTGAALFRTLDINTPETNIDDSVASFGFSLTGKYQLGQDDIKFGLITGTGLGRYVALNIANGAVLDANGDLDTIDSSGFFLAYRHLWSPQWRSTATYSGITIDNNVSLTGNTVSKSAQSIRLNLLYSPHKPLTFGGELTFANREIESGADGNMIRAQLSAKLSF